MIRTHGAFALLALPLLAACNDDDGGGCGGLAAGVAFPFPVAAVAEASAAAGAMD